MSINNVEIQDNVGNIYYPHTDASVVKFGDSTVAAQLSDKANNTDTNRTTTDKTVTGAINELNSNKLSKTSLVNNLNANVAGSPLDATQAKVLDDKVTSLPLQYDSKNIDTDTGNWAVVVVNANSTTNNTYPSANFGGIIEQREIGYFRRQIAIAGWGDGDMYVRSVNAGLRFDSTSTGSIKWKKVTLV